MRLTVFILGGLWLVGSACLAKAAETATIRSCMLVPEEEAQLPAQEAGVLVKILVREGKEAKAGQLLAQIDDAIPQAQRDVAKYKLAAAQRQAEDDIDIRFATKSAAVAAKEYEQALETNQQARGAVTQSEILRRLLEWEKMKLSIEKATKDVAVAKWQAKVAEAELAAATAAAERRQIAAPSDPESSGKKDYVVVELSRRLGEWVQVGEPVMRVVRLDRLRVNGVLEAKNYRPSDIQDRPVRLTVPIPHVGRETFSGKIVYVKPLIEAGYLQVRAVIDNRQQDGVWLLNPGMIAEMEIDLR
jgi:multidrug efflux pump subunit AcrA (membrane-fusion protein)